MAAACLRAWPACRAILASPVAELTGFALAVDCLSPRCGGERSYAVTALAACYGTGMTVGEVFAPDAVRAWL